MLCAALSVAVSGEVTWRATATRGEPGSVTVPCHPAMPVMHVARRLVIGASVRSRAGRVCSVGDSFGSRAGVDANVVEKPNDDLRTSGEHAVVTQLRHSLSRHSLVSHGTSVVTCVSGGVDSVALLLALHVVAPEWGLRLHVLHFNHGLRAESKSEAEQVKALAQRLHLPFHLREAPPGSWPPSGVSAAARAWRRGEALAFLGSLAAVPSAEHSGTTSAVIALAHHADDQRETVLLKLLRGCHISRITGMAPKRGPFIRPLLMCSKAQLTDFVRSQHVSWAEDASNADASYSRRNAVRHRLVPLLQELTGSGLDARLQDAQHQSRMLRTWLDGVQPAWAPRGQHDASDVVDTIGDDDSDEDGLGDWPDGEGDDAPEASHADDASIPPGELDLPRWRALPAVARLDQLHAFIASHLGNTAVAYSTLRELAARAESRDSRPRWTAHITSTWRLVRAGDRLRVQQWSDGHRHDGDGMEETSGPVVEMTTTCCGGLLVHHPAQWRVTLRQVPPGHDGACVPPPRNDAPQVEGHPGADNWWGAAAQAAGLTLHGLPQDGELTLRTRRDGDRFAPHWRVAHRGDSDDRAEGHTPSWKLRDLLRDAGVPVHVRDTLPLVQLDGALVAVYPAWTDARVSGHAGRQAADGTVSVHVTIATVRV